MQVARRHDEKSNEFQWQATVMRMATGKKYFLALRVGAAVGPHDLDSLREWAALGVISPEWKVCGEGEEKWRRIAEIPDFTSFPPTLQERLDVYRSRSTEPWWSDAPSEGQLEKLQHFEIPFDSNGLTNGRASELLGAFASIDPRREKQYQERSATTEQASQIRSFGGNPVGISYSKAKELLRELGDQATEEEELAAAVEKLMRLDLMINGKDAREIGQYRKLTKAQLQQLLTHLSEHLPNWQEMNASDLCALVPQLFPELIKVKQSRPLPAGDPPAAPEGRSLLRFRPFLVFVSACIDKIRPRNLKKCRCMGRGEVS